MKPRITVITLGVQELDRSVQFYRDLGWETEGIIGQEFENGAVAFFDLQGGLKLALWPRTSIEQDTGLSLIRSTGSAITIGHNVARKDQVEQIIQLAREADAKIVKEPAETFYGGYAAYFSDPDGHLWDIVWNPDFQ